MTNCSLMFEQFICSSWNEMFWKKQTSAKQVGISFHWKPKKTVSQPIVEEWATSIVPLLRSVSMKPKTCGVTPKHAPYAFIVFRTKLTKPQKWSSQLMETKNVTSGIRNLNMKEPSRSGIFNWETQKERKNRKNVWYSKTSAIVRTYWIPKSSEDWKKDEIETT